jgi:GTP-binding protein HflX
VSNGTERGAPDFGARGASGRAAVLHPYMKSGKANSRSREARLEEAVGLARAIDLDVVVAEVVVIARPRPATLFGSGVVEDFADLLHEKEIDVVCVDFKLSPVQQRNLETSFKCKVIDRTGLILEIFGERARTREGRLQVELAHLSYQRGRLVRSWTHLERQRGGFGFVGGPGETQIEADRRQIDERITRIKRQLETVRRTRGLHRQARRRVPYPVVALVGYTNAGKSTLFNRLTKANVFAEDLLFATLDPTMRELRLPSGRKVILSDTVGFVSDLPTDLIAAFGATLEEVTNAEIVVHVRDAAHADSEAQKADVAAVLGDLGIGPKHDSKMIEVMNKIDLLDPEDRSRLSNQTGRREDAVALSAQTGEGCDGFLELLDSYTSEFREIIDLPVELSDGATISWLYRHGEVINRRDDETFAHFQVGLDRPDIARLKKRMGISADSTHFK